MKSGRHEKIRAIIAEYPIETQDELLKKLRKAGFDLITTPMSEIEKQDGGLSCLSIRIPKRI